MVDSPICHTPSPSSRHLYLPLRESAPSIPPSTFALVCSLQDFFQSPSLMLPFPSLGFCLVSQPWPYVYPLSTHIKHPKVMTGTWERENVQPCRFCSASVNTMLSSCNHFLVNFIFLYCWFHHVYVLSIIHHLSADGHLGCLHFLATMKREQ